MIYMDLEKIYRERSIPNKYILAIVVSARARQLSERKGAAAGDEKFITTAVDDLMNGRIKYSVVEAAVSKKTDEPVEI
jgi:DNA-directed RNA polymerase subunit K/omega